MSNRFWSKVIHPPGSPCWMWTGAVNSMGYGVYGIRSKTYKAHRVAWYLTYGYWPKQLNHKCHNRACVRPSHLYDGTQQQNVDDSIALGTFRSGRVTTAKLTAEQVVEIRQKLPTHTRRQLAAEYGVSHGAINLIAWGKNWKN
jgi:HNH endonuclease